MLHGKTQFAFAAYLAFVAITLAESAFATSSPPPDHQIGGRLTIVGDEIPSNHVCPLRHTNVESNMTGFIGQTTVRQVFYNPLDHKIEAVYTFPLPHRSAVDDMTMLVGDRRVVGLIKPKEEARNIFNVARNQGHVAGLLDQERPNIFTQSVTNIEPGAEVVIEISYVETLKFDDGTFEYAFPMVVGPRYIPGGGSAKVPMQTGKPTAQVPDADKITPPVTPLNTRSGHDVSLTVNIDAGMPIAEPQSTLHDVSVVRVGQNRATVTLKDNATIPNKDFILRYKTTNQDVGDAFFVHTDDRGQFFTLFLQPPQRAEENRIVPRELVFVLDTSGSMRGRPIEKAKQLMSQAIQSMRPADTFNLITFAGNTRILWNQPRPNTQQNREEALAFLASRSGGGGTEMMSAINAALVQSKPVIKPPLTLDELRNLPADGRIVRFVFTPAKLNTSVLMKDSVNDAPTPLADWFSRRMMTARTHAGVPHVIEGTWSTQNGERVVIFKRWIDHDHATKGPMRVVCFMTDGYVGNDMSIINAVQNNVDTTRVFSFGIGNSVNRFLLEGMATAGRGEVEIVSLNDDIDTAVNRFCKRIAAPVLADVQLAWTGVNVSDVYPKIIPDLFTAKPILVHGRINGPVSGSVMLKGRTGAGEFSRSHDLTTPSDGDNHNAIASLWARAKVESLMSHDWEGLQQGTVSSALESEITQLGVDYRLMTQFTSFVAVEELHVTEGGTPTVVRVPVEMPDGVQYEGVFGQKEETDQSLAFRNVRGRTTGLRQPKRKGASSLRRGITEFAAETLNASTWTTDKRVGWEDGTNASLSTRAAESPAAAEIQTQPIDQDGVYMANYDTSTELADAIQRFNESEDKKWKPVGKPWMNYSVGTAYDIEDAFANAGIALTKEEFESLTEEVNALRTESGVDTYGKSNAIEGKRQKIRNANWINKLSPEVFIAEALSKGKKQSGSYEFESVTVVKYMVDVRVYLKDMTDETKKALTDADLKIQADSKTANFVVGTIDIRKLKTIAKLDVVLHITSITGK